MALKWPESLVLLFFVVSQGVIYSATAAANYSNNVFDTSIPNIPAKRLGYPEEVSTCLW